ncbi:hypothetical protein SNE40_010897 [Patella caerulea]|uniref:Uncharacterized protein n=1 Tax=Patella caerulea TaxID=87958 RepID=A0AAN8JZ65_PATCE
MSHQTLTRDVRCLITVKYRQSVNAIALQEQAEITIYQLIHLYKVEQLKQKLVNELSALRCVLDDLPKPPQRLITVILDDKGLAQADEEKLKNNIIQIFNTLSGYCEEITVSPEKIKILKDSDFLFTVIRNRGSEVDIVYCEDENVEWANKMRILSNPQGTDCISDFIHDFDSSVAQRSGQNSQMVSNNGNDNTDALPSNDSQGQPTFGPNTEPEDITIHNNTNVPSTTLLEVSGGDPRIFPDRTLKGCDSSVIVNHPTNGQDAVVGGNGEATVHKNKSRRQPTTGQNTKAEDLGSYKLN